MTTEILRLIGPSCRDAARSSLIRASTTLNGIDFVEYRQNPTPPEHVLEVHFLRKNPPAGLRAEDFLVTGGTRIVGIHATGDPVAGASPEILELPISAQGDFSTYTLSIGWSRQPDETWRFDETKGVDRLFSVAPINFRSGCPVDFDCVPQDVYSPERPVEPALDYLAKDYASFRQLLLDVVAQRNPRWLERNPADLGIAVLELFAHEGDQLSYFQDAVANEAFLDTARQRVSAKRHAKLVDYTMHDGRNAWAYVHVAVSANGTLPVGTQILTRITTPLRRKDSPPGVVISDPGAEEFDKDDALNRARLFETSTTLKASVRNNQIRLHTWGNRQCCLGRGTVNAQLYSVDQNKAVRPVFAKGDYLLLEEVRGPETGLPADADPAHRAVVQIAGVDENLTDPVYRDVLLNGEPQARVNATDDPLPLVGVTWRQQDALTFPLCLSAISADRAAIADISIARGNMVLADHGRTVKDEYEFNEPVPDRPFRLRLLRPGLTLQSQPDDLPYDGVVAITTAERPDLSNDVRVARAAIVLRVSGLAPTPELWTVVPDLLESSPFHQHFVSDVGNDGFTTLRFGDGEYGRALTGATAVTAMYRIGNGTAGNIAADALFHIIQPSPAPGWPTVEAIRNPLSAQQGTDPESIEEVRQYAPAAFRAQQYRAVTEADYADAARRIAGVAGAVAAFRWTGSWYTAFVGIDPDDPANLLTAPGGATRLAPRFKEKVQTALSRFRLAGYDLELRTAQYVPLHIEIALCVAPNHFRGDVAEAVRVALSAGLDPQGRPGFFHPSKWTFGQSVYLSMLYAAVKAIEGVDSLEVKSFHPVARDQAGELDAGVIPIGAWEIARLDNDPNRMENGELIVTAGGGK
jgi:hypothetical protein